ncbi:MAG: hypothetical protein FJW39_02635 [Acidobacteria bacterium]|nr:hypothetical protein [Acidobacteriota bacterium]
MTAARTRRKQSAPELDWRDLASGPALRGLTEALGTPEAPVPAPALETPTVLDPPTVGVTGFWRDGAGTLFPAKRVAEVKSAAHSMTLGEERFYQSVWNAGADDGVVVESDQSRIFSLGYDRLAALVRLDEKSVRALIPKLAAKQILEILAPEESATRTGRTYRIFGPAEVLARQRRAGLTHVVKNGRAVEFVTPSDHVSPTVGVSIPEPQPEAPAIPITSPAAAGQVEAALAVYGPQAAAQSQAIIAAVLAKSPTATLDELVFFIHERGRAVRAGSFSNPGAYLAAYVPQSFTGAAIQWFRRARGAARSLSTSS